MSQLVLSLFPGIGMLDMAFEEEGFCVVRGPDLLWGGDIRRFHPPAGKFDGVIGGPPCQAFSALANLVRHNGHEPKFGNLIPEFERVISEVRPTWFVMENVRGAPLPVVDGYKVHSQFLNTRWLGEEQNRLRRISFGTNDGRSLLVETKALEQPLGYENPFAVTARHEGRMPWMKHPPAVLGDARETPVAIGGSGKRKAHLAYPPAVNAGGGAPPSKRHPPSVTGSDGGGSLKHYRYRLPEACRLQGLPEDFLAHVPFTAQAKLQAVANGVPLPMGRAVAKAVLAAMSP